MPRLKAAQLEPSPLVKNTLATQLREEIMQGHLAPGQRIIEGYWAERLGVAQTSVREAINLLIAEGFVTKASGRSARVTSYSTADIAHIYELRGALEGRLTAERKPELGSLETALREMRARQRKETFAR